jgi:hypothetical protein
MTRNHSTAQAIMAIACIVCSVLLVGLFLLFVAVNVEDFILAAVDAVIAASEATK